MLDLWVIRHGDASWEAPSDKERALTQRGIEQVISVSKELKLPSSMTLWCSPYLRAQQTARYFCETVSCEVQQTSEPLLVPESDPLLVAELIEASEETNLMIVSHMPLVARLANYLDKAANLGTFQTAQVVHFKFYQGHWKVKQVYLP